MVKYSMYEQTAYSFRAGADDLTAQQYLGHADPAIKLRIYTHLADETQMKDAEKVRRAFL